MKRIISIFIVLSLLTFVAPFSFALESGIKVYVNSHEIDFPDVNPYVDSNGRTIVPVRPVCEALKASISWQDETQTATIKLGNIDVELIINKTQYKINGVLKQMDTAATLEQGRIFVPLRFVVEALGAKVEWNAITKSISINKKLNTTMPNKVYITVGDAGYVVDNKTVLLNKDYLKETPCVYDGNLLIPVRQLADIFNGSYYFEPATNKCVLSIIGSTFEFESYTKTAIVNGKTLTLPYEVREDRGFIRVPAQVFVDNVPGYDVEIYLNSAIVFRNKSVYSSDGNLLQRPRTPQFTQYREQLLKYTWKTEGQSQELTQKVDRISDEIVASISHEGMSDYEKVLAVNKYMVDNIKYDYTYKAGAWDAFLKRESVCGGFANATGLLLEKMGVKSIYVVGYGSVNGFEDIDQYEMLKIYNSSDPKATKSHAWNIVGINGNYYHIDTTWNQCRSSQEQSSQVQSYEYFLLSDEQLMCDHAWRRDKYPECKNEYDENALNDLKNKGYPVIHGVLSLEDNTKNEAYVKVEVSSNNAPWVTTKRILKVVSGEPTYFSMGFDKRFAQSNIYAKFYPVKRKVGGTGSSTDYTSDVTENLKVDANGDYYSLVMKPVPYNKISSRVVVPSTVKINKKYPFVTKITIIERLENGYSYGDEMYANGELTPGCTEVPIEFDAIIPQKEYFYSVQYWFNMAFSGGEPMPFVSKGYIDANCNTTTQEVIIDGGINPLNKITINLAKNDAYKEGGRAEVESIDFDELTAILKGFNFGNHAVIKELKTEDDIMKLESEEPVSKDSNGNIYYSKDMPNGVNIYRSYNLEQKNYSSLYSINLNNIKVTQNNYMELFDILNNLLADSLGEKTLQIPKLHDNGKTKEVVAKSEEIFGKLAKNYADIDCSYAKDEYKYFLTMSGFDNKIHVHLSARRME